MQMSIYSKKTRTKTSIDTQYEGKRERERHASRGEERERYIEIREERERYAVRREESEREMDRERDRDSVDGNTKW